MSGYYVYAVTRRAVAPRVRGVFDRPLRCIAVERLHVVVEAAPRAPTPTLARLRIQAAALDALVRMGVDLLPARFGTFMRGAEELEAAVRARAPELRRRLREVRGCVQVTLRVTSATGRLEVGPRRAASRTARTPGRPSGAAFLRSRAARARGPANDPAVRALTRAAAGLVRHTRIEAADRVALVFHLVPRTAIGPYVAAMAEVAARVDASVGLTGPFAPFAFVDGVD